MTTGISYLNPNRPEIPKDPAAVLDYGFDWTDWLAEHGADEIASAEIAVTGGVTATPPTHDGKIVATKVSGGTAGVEATVTCRITTNGTPPLTDDRSIWLRVTER